MKLHLQPKRHFMLILIIVATMILYLSASILHKTTPQSVDQQNLCLHTLVSESLSPSGNFKAIAYHSSAGGAAGFVYTNISVVPTDYLLPTKEPCRESFGNIYSANQSDIQSLEWGSDTTLNISIESSNRVYKQENRFGKVSIQYL